MKTSIFYKFRAYFRSSSRWFWDTPERALEDAYEAVLKIKAIEDTYFGGSKVDFTVGQFSDSEVVYFKRELKNNLNAAKIRLSEFNLSHSIISDSVKKLGQGEDNSLLNSQDRSAMTLEKLRFIDEILRRYSRKSQQSQALISIPRPPNQAVSKTPINDNAVKPPASPYPNIETVANQETIVDKSSFLPRSILGTLSRVRNELDPKAEEELIKNFRVSKFKTVISLRFLLLMILIPLLTQQITKNFVIGPAIDNLKNQGRIEIFLNTEMEEEAFVDLERYERKLHFQHLTGRIPELTDEEMEERLEERAVEIQREYRDRSADSIKNIFADLFSFMAFCLVVVTSKREIEVVKSFLDDVVYGLSDSAKAFIIILFTDMFVGFHSPHGWEVILEGISRHLGLPESREFIFLFIATFPVILDTVFKYWIFRYLNRISPSAVATYRNMNE
ncbi:MAG: proton extrusion protein PcxA [Desertifilum sp.]|nr:proton extrusion protein PcxA [Desertifilum sp.]